MLPRSRRALVIAASIPIVLLLANLLLAAVTWSLGLRLVAQFVCASAPLLLALLCSLHSGVLGDRSLVLCPYLGFRPLGCGGPAVRLPFSFLVPSHLSNVPFPFSRLLPVCHQGFSSVCCGVGLSHIKAIAPAPPPFTAAFFYLYWLWLPFLLLYLCCIILSCASAYFTCSYTAFEGFLRSSLVSSVTLHFSLGYYSLSFGVVGSCFPFPLSFFRVSGSASFGWLTFSFSGFFSLCAFFLAPLWFLPVFPILGFPFGLSEFF